VNVRITRQRMFGRHGDADMAAGVTGGHPQSSVDVGSTTVGQAGLAEQLPVANLAYRPETDPRLSPR